MRKLSTTLKWEHVAEVACPSGFPLDMLRYDRCSPFQEKDSHEMARTLIRQPSGTTIIKLLVVRHSESKTPNWTTDRWRSFGCTIRPLDADEAADWCRVRSQMASSRKACETAQEKVNSARKKLRNAIISLKLMLNQVRHDIEAGTALPLGGEREGAALKLASDIIATNFDELLDSVRTLQVAASQQKENSS